MKSCDWWLDLKSTPVVYKAAGTGAIGDIEEGALYLVTVGQVAAGTAAAAMRVAFRLLPGRLRLKTCGLHQSQY